ncbi:MAG: DUF1707 SHOCT-like domain-containing protein [Chloroflexota bacterium]
MMNHDDVLVGDGERNQSVTVLRDACADGRLTLDEFSDRVNAVFAARTRGELTVVTRDLPAAEPTTIRRRGPTNWTVCIMSDTRRNDHWRVEGKTRALTIMGSCTLDLRRASVLANEIEIDTHVVMGSVKIIVPRGTEVELGGLTIMGNKQCKFEAEPARSGAPFVRVGGFVLMGSVDVVMQ